MPATTVRMTKGEWFVTLLYEAAAASFDAYLYGGAGERITARALENVQIPERDFALNFIDEELAFYNIKEAVRIREARRSRQELP